MINPIIPVLLKVTQSALRGVLGFLIRDLVYCVRLCTCVVCVQHVLRFCKTIAVGGTQLCVS